MNNYYEKELKKSEKELKNCKEYIECLKQHIYYREKINIYHALMMRLYPQLKFYANYKHFEKLGDVLVKNNKATIRHKYMCGYNMEKKDIKNLKDEIIEIELNENRYITIHDFYEYCNNYWKNKIYELCDIYIDEIIVNQDDKGNYILDATFC